MTWIAKQIVVAPAFQRFILAVILLAGVLTGLETSNSLVTAYGPLLNRLNLLVLVIFIAEMTLKLAAHGRRPWLYFVSFILLGTMIMLNLFIGIIMNSMSEMHAEMEERDRARHVKEFGRVTLLDDFNLLEGQLDALRAHAAKLKTRLAHTPERTGEGPFKTASRTTPGSAPDCNAARGCSAGSPPARK